MIKTNEHCASVNVLLQYGNRLLSLPCIYPAGHQGPCADDRGNHWVRVSEHLRRAKEDE